MLFIKKNIHLILGVMVIIIVMVSLLLIRGNEDAWLCVNNNWVKHGNPSASMPITGCGNKTEATGINFDETGHFVIDNSGMKPGVWFLVYERPGAPALTAELLFDENSVCRYNGQTGKCPDVLLPSSAMTRVQGVNQDNVVKVYSAVSGQNF